jgi:hypothetical protein
MRHVIGWTIKVLGVGMDQSKCVRKANPRVIGSQQEVTRWEENPVVYELYRAMADSES